MRSEQIGNFVLGCMLLCMILVTSGWCSQSPEAESVPQTVTKPVSVRIGEAYEGSTRLYDAAVTVLEVVRGEKAWALVKAAGQSNKKAESGTEYLAVRARFSFGEKGDKGNETYAVREEQFAPFSSEGKPYDRPFITPPQPALSGRLYLGETLEGWIIFLVSTSDTKPLMSFGHENYGRTWFRLY